MEDLFTLAHTRGKIYAGAPDRDADKWISWLLELRLDDEKWTTIVYWRCRKKHEQRGLQMATTLRMIAERIEVMIAGGWAFRVQTFYNSQNYNNQNYNIYIYSPITQYSISRICLSGRVYGALFRSNTGDILLKEFTSLPDSPRDLSIAIMPESEGTQWLVDHYYPGRVIVEYPQIIVGKVGRRLWGPTTVFVCVDGQWQPLTPPVGSLACKTEWAECTQRIQERFDNGWSLVSTRNGQWWTWARGDERGWSINVDEGSTIKRLGASMEVKPPTVHKPVIDSHITSIARVVQEMPERRSHQLLAADEKDNALDVIIRDPDIIA